ncbi:SH3 domain-containing protein [Elsinoe australis]|uniref:SH3 domain-containing protein n=1 Tax=Elsinoe australis TaxID=40998 RepID=A0A2P7YDD0_9PEZI|nr:SH3 domain-containing protein [Elsinoe australis]
MSTPPFKVKAVYEYSSPHEDDLSFPNGQIITVTEEEDADWYVGSYTDEQGKEQNGLFPKNFVEKYEPEIPSRPARPSKAKGNVQSPPTQSAEFAPQEEEAAPPPPVEFKPAPAPVAEPEPEPVPVVSKPPPPPREEPKPTPAPVEAISKPEPPPATSAKGPPPPVAAKSSSFKDRIAAFNKGADAAPPLPFKPSSGASNYGIKKPFVAPPPSRNAYVPPPKPEPVQKIYRRDEDPEIAGRLAEDRAAAESAGLTTSQDLAAAEAEAGDEDTPKPQSLKDRIALLQKQQMEQAQRRADTASKEKPKRPPKKRTESSDQLADDEAAQEDTERQLPIRTSQDAPEETELPRTRTLSPPPMSPSTREHEILSDGNEADQSAAGETTEANEDTSDAEEAQRQRSVPALPQAQRAPAAPTQEPDVGDEEDTTEGQSEEEEMDEETRRRMELRDRMAKISGGMGMAGMFGPQPGMAIAPPRKRSTKSTERKQRRQSEDTPASPPPVPRAMVPVPGMMPQVASPQSEDTELAVEKEDEMKGSITEERDPDEVPDVEDVKPQPPPKESRRSTTEDRAAPPVPGDRPVPVLPPASSRPVPPAPPARMPQSPDPSEQPPQSKRSSVETPRGTEPPTGRGVPPPVPGGSVDSARSPPPVPGQSSYFGNDAQSEASITPGVERRTSRAAPPPVPVMAPSSPPIQSRPPPPLPPSAAPQAVDEPDEGESEYEGDYDTDIASSDKHKAALKQHVRQPSLDDSTTADEMSLQQSPPPIPTSPPTQHRAVPPPPPGQASRGKPSAEIPRAAPPPLPPSRPPPADEDEEDDGLDMYKRYQESQRGAPPLPPTAAPAPVPIHAAQEATQDSSDDLYDKPSRKSVEAPRTVPPPPTESSPRAPDVARLGGRQSMDASRTLNRKSMDAPRPSTSGDGFIATDVDLSEESQWWTQPSTPPPVFQNRSDILYEVEESSTSKRGGKTTISKDVYVLFHDYSQTVVTAQFDKSNPSDVALEQRHEPPPHRLRQDQLEAAWQTYGARIAEQADRLASGKKDKDAAGVGDGSAAALAHDLIRNLAGSPLLPVGNRAYGAPVYANIGNASVQQFDEIRAGDLVTFRNAKLQGKHGLQKYSTEVGGGAGGGHVAVVVEWDGTKKKVRAVEQGRDEKGRVKVRGESYRLGDLKSGEVRVWRVVGRGWVGWDEK